MLSLKISSEPIFLAKIDEMWFMAIFYFMAGIHLPVQTTVVENIGYTWVQLPEAFNFEHV